MNFNANSNSITTYGDFSMNYFKCIEKFQVHEFFQCHDMDAISIKLNRLSLWIGWLGAFGISLVANFQETSVLKVHIRFKGSCPV